jgi:hypothetical protein
MPPELQGRFEAIERQRADLESFALLLPDAQVNWTPGASVWSVGQIVHHLVLSDETVGRAQDLEAVNAEAPLFRILPRAWRRALVLMAFNRNVILPLPSPAVEPRGDVPLSKLLSRWARARREMRRVLDTLPGDETRYSHPVLGPLTAAQMLELGQTHTAYHTRQIEALQRDPAFPRRAEA